MQYFLPLLLVASISLGVLQWRRSGRFATATTSNDCCRRIARISDRFKMEAHIAETSAEAQAALPTLRELFAQRPEHTTVQIRYQPPQGPSEIVWANLRSINDSTLTCHIERLPSNKEEKVSIDYFCPVSGLLDWHVRMNEREHRGVFTIKVLRRWLRENHGEQGLEIFDRVLKRGADWTDAT